MAVKTQAPRDEKKVKAAQKSVQKKPYVRRYKDAVSMAKLLPKQLKNSAQRRGFQAGQVVLHWEKICPEYAKVALPVKLSYAGGLTLVVGSDSAKQEILLSAPQIMARVNGFLGDDVVVSLRCVTGVMPVLLEKRAAAVVPSASAVEAAAKVCDTLPQDELQAALIRLGALIYNDKE